MKFVAKNLSAVQFGTMAPGASKEYTEEAFKVVAQNFAPRIRSKHATVVAIDKDTETMLTYEDLLEMMNPKAKK